MVEFDDEVIVNDFVFFNFEHPTSSAVVCNIIKVDGNPIISSDRESITNLINKIGLWENYIKIKKAEKNEIENSELTILQDNYRENMLILGDFEKDKRYLGYPRYIISARFSPEESLRRTKGNTRAAEITIDYVKNGLINVAKWLILKKTRTRLD